MTRESTLLFSSPSLFLFRPVDTRVYVKACVIRIVPARYHSFFSKGIDSP